MADTCAAAGIVAGPRTGHPGCWIGADTPLPRKIGALGIRVARGVSFHGIALNVTTNLADFDLIDPCGMPGLRSTSIARERERTGLPSENRSTATEGVVPADSMATTASVARAAATFGPALATRLGFELVGDLPPAADPAAERRSLKGIGGRLGAARTAAADAPPADAPPADAPPAAPAPPAAAKPPVAPAEAC